MSTSCDLTLKSEVVKKVCARKSVNILEKHELKVNSNETEVS